jgi:uncharacterized protein YjdB
MPNNATDKSISWSSSNPNVATVNNSGVVTAVAAGSATITATSNANTGINATCVVTVTSVPVTETLTLNLSSVSASNNPIGNTITLSAGTTFLFITDNVTGGAVSRQACTMTSSNENVATISEWGTITLRAVGTTTLRAVRNADGAVGTLVVTVTSGVSAPALRLVIGENSTPPYSPYVSGTVAIGRTLHLGIDANNNVANPSWYSRLGCTLTSSNPKRCNYQYSRRDYHTCCRNNCN